MRYPNVPPRNATSADTPKTMSKSSSMTPPGIQLHKLHAEVARNRGKAQYLRDRKPTPSLCFCDPDATSLRPGPGGHSAVKPAAPLTRHHPHDTRRSGSGLGAAPRSEFALQRQPSVRQACATGRARTAADTNAVHDRLLQSMRVRFLDSEKWGSPVKPRRSQNYVNPQDARRRVRVAIVARDDHPGGAAEASRVTLKGIRLTRSRRTAEPFRRSAHVYALLGESLW